MTLCDIFKHIIKFPLFRVSKFEIYISLILQKNSLFRIKRQLQQVKIEIVNMFTSGRYNDLLLEVFVAKGYN